MSLETEELASEPVVDATYRANAPVGRFALRQELAIIPGAVPDELARNIAASAIDAFSLAGKVRTIKKARSGTAHA